jgi:hypothetical protein
MCGAAIKHPACASVRYRKNLVPCRSKKIMWRTAPQQANSQRFECDAQVTILPLLRCGIARLTMNSKSPRCVSHPLQPKVCESASLVAPSQIRPRIGDALRRQELDAIPSTDKAAESWAAFFVAVCFFYPSVACPLLCAAAWRCRQGHALRATYVGLDAADRRRPICRAGSGRMPFCPTKGIPRRGTL